MASSPAIDAARHFLKVACEGDRPSDAELTVALDRLVSVYPDVPDVGSSHDGDPPRDSGPDFFKRLGARYPDYGFYPTADPMGQLGESPSVGDAIDDLGDIILDMRTVVWLADHAGNDDAHWSFRLMFFHWGTHARDLLRYLHGRQFG